jgi:hypothetical protein
MKLLAQAFDELRFSRSLENFELVPNRRYFYLKALCDEANIVQVSAQGCYFLGRYYCSYIAVRTD